MCRWVWNDQQGSWVVDPARRLAGRGVSVHRRVACVRRMATDTGWTRPWQRRGLQVERMSASTALARMNDAWVGQFSSAVRRANRRGGLVTGVSAIRARLGEVRMLWLSEDVDVDVSTGLVEAEKVVRFGSAEWVASLAEGDAVVVAVTHSAMAREMLHAAACAGELRRSHE